MTRTYADEEWDRIEASWTATDDEPWSWTCGSCGDTMARAAIEGHDCDPLAPARGCLVGTLLGLLAWAAIAVVVGRVVR